MKKLENLIEKYPNVIGTIGGFAAFLYFASNGKVLMSLVAAGLVILCGVDARKELE